MTFDGTEGGQIPLVDAAGMTANYRNQNPDSTLAHFFGKDIINQILSQNGCVGIRMYYGIDSDDEKQLLLVGTDANGDDMTDLVADLSSPCPRACGKENSLNS